MSKYYAIGFEPDDRVFIGEDKILTYDTVDSAGAPQDLTAFTLEWVLRAGPEGTVLLTKTSDLAEITVAAVPPLAFPNQARVQLDDGDTVEETGPIPPIGTILIAPGNYYHTLKRINTDDEQVLSFGDFLLSVPATR